MKLITSNLIKFAISAIFLTLIFRYSLSYSISHSLMIGLFLVAILYAISMFGLGYFFGTKDRAYLPFNDIGFRFHLITYIFHNLVSELWFLLGFNSDSERISSIHYTAIIWGALVLFHFIIYLKYRNESINDLDKNDLFD